MKLLDFILTTVVVILVSEVKTNWTLSKHLLRPTGYKATANCSCGRVFNYTEGSSGKTPWLAIIYAKKTLPNNDTRIQLLVPVCWGSLINDRYILSSAHCTSKYRHGDLLVRLEAEDSSSLRKVSNVKNHPRFSIGGNQSYDNDISLLKLRTPVDLHTAHRRQICPVCLPPLPPPTSTEMEGFLKKCQLCDFPRNLNKRRMVCAVSTKSSSFGLLVLQGLRKETCFKHYTNRVEVQYFCAEVIGGEKLLENRERCNTDSGSPLTTMRRVKEECDLDYLEEEGARFVQTGISSVQNDCVVTRQHHPYPILLFVDVSKYRKWIGDNTEDALYCFNSPS